jgi:hypothetical protein
MFVSIHPSLGHQIRASRATSDAGGRSARSPGAARRRVRLPRSARSAAGQAHQHQINSIEHVARFGAQLVQVSIDPMPIDAIASSSAPRDQRISCIASCSSPRIALGYRNA